MWIRSVLRFWRDVYVELRIIRFEVITETRYLLLYFLLDLGRTLKDKIVEKYFYGTKMSKSKRLEKVKGKKKKY